MISIRWTSPFCPDRPEVRELGPGSWRVGEGADWPIPALSTGAFSLEVSPWGTIAVGGSEEAQVGGKPLRAGARRLLRPADPLVVLGHRFELLSAAAETLATRAGALGLFGDEEVALHGAAPATELIWLNGPDCGRRLSLGEGITVVGRSDAAAARTRDRLASKRHAEIHLRGERALLKDLRSKNGVLVAGKRIRSEAELRGGEVLEIGQTLLAFELRAPTPQPPPTPPAPPPPAVPTQPPAPAPKRRRRPPLLVAELAAVLGAAAFMLTGAAVLWAAIRTG